MLCACGLTPTAADPTGISAINNAPNTTLIGLQTPPVIAVPPASAAAIDGTSKSLPNPIEDAAPLIEITHNPAKPEKNPESAKASTFNALTLIPESVAARSLNPIAANPCPVAVKRKTPHSSTAAKLGPLELKVREENRVNIPVWAGVAAIVAGGLVLLVSARK